MSLFVDQLLIQLSDPARLLQLLSPPDDTNRARLRALVNAVYDMPFATIHEIREVQVTGIESELPLSIPGRWCGTWQQTVPSYTRSEITLDQQSAPLWLDLLASLQLSLVLEVDTGEVESVLTRDIGDFTTLDDFRSRFRFIDLDAFMARHHLGTVEELKEAYSYLITEIRLRAPGPFDPTNEANRYTFPLNVAFLLRDSVDVAAGLRDAKVARAAAEKRYAFRDEINTADVRTYCAPVLLFPEGALAGLPFTATALQEFYATERVLSIFATPS